MAGQGLDGYVVCEDGWQEVDRFWIASIGDAACLDELDVWRIFGGRTGPLAEAQPSVWVCGHSAAIPWVDLQSRIDVCGFGLVGGDRRPRPKVSLMGSDEGNVLDTHKCLYAAEVPFLASMLGTRASERNICGVGADTVECHGRSRTMGCVTG